MFTRKILLSNFSKILPKINIPKNHILTRIINKNKSEKIIDSKTKQNLNLNELKNRLSPLEYRVTQEKGTEQPFTGEYCNHKEQGNYCCIVCGEKLFESEYKFDSGTGWPSFYKSNEQNISLIQDNNYNMIRTEVLCKNCGSHLGHVFDDGPKPTSKRFCINSCSLLFENKK